MKAGSLLKKTSWLDRLVFGSFYIELALSILMLVIIFNLFGCATMPDQADVSSQIDKKETVFHSLPIDVNGKRYVGTGVLPKADKYKITVYPSAKIERIVWTTCHQQWVVDKPESNSDSWFDNRKDVTFTFVPQNGIEDESSCALEIAVSTADVMTNYALLEFQDKREEVVLFADMKCNGSSSQSVGVGICQAAAGLHQQISFIHPVLVPKKPGCDVLKTTDEKTYSFDIAPGECQYYFTAQAKSQNGKRLLYRLTTVGYTKVPKR